MKAAQSIIAADRLQLEVIWLLKIRPDHKDASFAHPYRPIPFVSAMMIEATPVSCPSGEAPSWSHGAPSEAKLLPPAQLRSGLAQSIPVPATTVLAPPQVGTVAALRLFP